MQKNTRPQFCSDKHLDALDEYNMKGHDEAEMVRRLEEDFILLSREGAQEIVTYWKEVWQDVNQI